MNSNDEQRYGLLVIGLGNPGRKYTETRHNIGWMVASELCKKYSEDPRLFRPYCYFAEMEIENNRVIVALPVTYMNKSGEAAAWLSKKFEIPPVQIIVISDEYNFPLGKLHLKKGGSDGGHNGLASVIEHLDTPEFWRLRCGIGKNFPPGMMVEYVLSKFYKEEIKQRDIMLENAVKAIEYIIREGTSKAMSEINSGKLFSTDS